VGESVTNIFRRWDDVLALKRGEAILPSFCDFHTSNVCNQNCLGCAYGGALDGLILPEADHFRIVDELLEVGVKAFEFCGGGEPTMLPYLPKLMNHMKGKAHFSLMTNGLLMTDELIEALVQGATFIRISLEASCQEDYAAYKRVNPKQWDTVLKNIGRLTAANGTGDLEISVKFAAGRSLRGRAHYERAIELGRSLGARRITIKGLRHKPEELSEADRISEDAILRDVIHRERASDIVSPWIAPLDPVKVDPCWLTPMQTIVDHLGDCYICCYYYNGRHEEERIGNLISQRFMDFWMGDQHRKLLAELRREKCFEVDCKFMKHTMAVAQAMNRGHGEWL
jgi:sulfatase maturation enzyme AslB (radical SAM superfamily)